MSLAQRAVRPRNFVCAPAPASKKVV